MERKLVKQPDKPKKHVRTWEKRINVRPLGGPQMSPAQQRRVAGKRIARALRGFLIAVDRKKAADVPYLDLVPYAEKVVDLFANDFKLKLPKRILDIPGKKE
jgi:hypothetical protein